MACSIDFNDWRLVHTHRFGHLGLSSNRIGALGWVDADGNFHTNFAGLFVGVAAILAPGIGRPAAEWLRSVSLLRKAAQAPGLDKGRVATMADMDRLIWRIPAFSILSSEERKSLLKDISYIEAPEGTAIVRQGETSDAAFFILDGGSVAGRQEDSRERVLEVHAPGDFFGEIAALTGLPRTANVVTNQPLNSLRVPATTLRQMSGHPELNRVFLSKVTERMLRMEMIDSPKINVLDQQVLRVQRTAEPEVATQN